MTENYYINTKSFDGRTLTITYTVVETCNIYEDPQYSSVYSLFGAMYDECGVIESAFIYDVTREKGRAHDIATLLCNEFVTPNTMGYVVEDIL